MPHKSYGHLENVVMDELSEAARTCSELVMATGLCKKTVRKVIGGLAERGLVVCRMYGKTFAFEMARTRKAA